MPKKVEDKITIAGITGVPTAPQEYKGPTGLSDNITSTDLRLPRVALLQSKSPQVEAEASCNGVPYKAGMFIDTLTQDIIGSPMTLVPVFVFKNIIKWKPRSEGGGMLWKAIHPTAEQLKDTQWNGTNKPAADVYINAVCMINDGATPLIVSFCKTSLKAGQDLATLIMLSGQAWKYTYFLDSLKVANSKGSYYVMRIKRGAPTTADQMIEAASMYENVKDMTIDTDYDSTNEEDISATKEPTEF